MCRFPARKLKDPPTNHLFFYLSKFLIIFLTLSKKVCGGKVGSEVQLCDSFGLFSNVPQLFKSLHVLVCVLSKHSDQSVHSQNVVQVGCESIVHSCDSSGLSAIFPQLFRSVQVLVCVLSKHSDQSVHSQNVVHIFCRINKRLDTIETIVCPFLKYAMK